MPRILGVDIPNDKRTVISLQYIYGIGPHLAAVLCERTGIDPEKRARDLSEDDLAQAGLAAGQRIHGGRPAPPPDPTEHRATARHRLLSWTAAPQGAAGPRPADPDECTDPQRTTQDGRREEGRQGNALMPALGRMAVSCRDDSPDFRRESGNELGRPDGRGDRPSQLSSCRPGPLTRRGVGLARRWTSRKPITCE